MKQVFRDLLSGFAIIGGILIMQRNSYLLLGAVLFLGGLDIRFYHGRSSHEKI